MLYFEIYTKITTLHTFYFLQKQCCSSHENIPLGSTASVTACNSPLSQPSLSSPHSIILPYESKAVNVSTTSRCRIRQCNASTMVATMACTIATTCQILHWPSSYRCFTISPHSDLQLPITAASCRKLMQHSIR